MTTMPEVDITLNPNARLPIANSVAGRAALQRFVAELHMIVGGADKMRFLWVPKPTDTLTATTLDKDARVITWDATVAARLTNLGSGSAQDFNGSSAVGRNEAETPGVADLTFGDSTNDEPLSVMVLCKPDVNNVAMTLLAKEDVSTAEEYALELNSSGHLVVRLTDESETGAITATYAVAVGTDFILLGFSYDGTGTSSGLRVYKNGLVVASAKTDSSYTAMETTAAKVYIGARYLTAEQFFNGRIALVAVIASQIVADQQWAAKDTVNAFFGLSL